jgi:HAMP domain-containing protein
VGLTQKILLFTSLLVVALVAITVAFTTIQADRLAHDTLRQALRETREVWETYQADSYNKLKLGIRVLGNDPAFKALVEGTDQATVLDSLRERNQELKADFFLATDPQGVVLARTDRPAAEPEDLSADPLVMKPLEGEESAGVWRQGDRLYHAVSVPMQTGPDLKGVLVAGYALNEPLAAHIRKLTHSQVAFLSQAPGQPPRLASSSLGPDEPTLSAAVQRGDLGSAADGAPRELDLASGRHMGVQVPLVAATGEPVGSVVALRSLGAELAAFRGFRNGLLAVALGVMAVGLGIAYFVASRITGPVRRLADMVERARDGSYVGKVAVDTRDEIGTLARTFNNLMADLREKEQMIDFLREGMTPTKAPGVTDDASLTKAPTREMPVVTPAGTLRGGGLFAGRYDIRGTVGTGGMGVVYRAHDRQLDEEVALKVLRSDVLREDPGLLERFKQEIKLARRITHRNVLRTHDFGEAEATPYISMEYLEGVTLKDLIRSRGAVPLGVGLSVAKQACLGLEAAHLVGVVHRDIKPQNMLILPETGELKIMDFGIARVSEVKGGQAGLTTTGMVMGTPDYIPPEQAQGRPADFRSDIYSLGVVLYEIFTGSLPFDGGTPLEVVLAHMQKAPRPPRALNPALPAELEAIVLRCLEKNPDRRYQRMDNLLADLSLVSSRLEPSAA